MHNHFRSRFLINSLSALGFCSSYAEVKRFEENSAACVSQDIFNRNTDKQNSTILFAADNVDHNIMTIDGKSTFHGMGMIATVTPGVQFRYSVTRKKITN